MRPPVSDSNRCLVSASSAAAPEKQILIDLKSTLPLLHVGVIEERDVQRRHAVEERRLHAADRREQIGEVARIGHERERIAVDERQRLHADVGVDMKERQRQQDHVASPRRAPIAVHALTCRPAMTYARVLAEHAFGRAGRAAAHQQHRRIVGGHASRARRSSAMFASRRAKS